MAETKKKETGEILSKEEAKPVDDLTLTKKELELAYKENAELQEKYNKLLETANNLYKENQGLRAAHKAIAALL
jgi:FtsZ-binding cell division protein ZapB